MECVVVVEDASLVDEIGDVIGEVERVECFLVLALEFADVEEIVCGDFVLEC